MNHRANLKAIVLCSLLVGAMVCGQAFAQAADAGGRQRGRGGFALYGDWQVKMQFGERQFDSILSFTREREGKWKGSWISFWGIGDLTDVKFEEEKLTFSNSMPGRGGEARTSKFEGTIKEGKLSGTLKSERGETKVEGKRARRTSRAVGIWDMKIKVGEREYTGTLTITADKEGKLSGVWKSRRGERPVTDVKYERGRLSYKRTIKTEDNEWTSTFEGNIRGNAITGKVKSDRGEAEVTGQRVNGDIIGTWNLEIASEEGSTKQRLRINPDMTALYGSNLVKKVDVKDGKISFKIVLEFGDQKYEMNVEGKIEENKLAGELKTSRGNRKITGTKVIRRFGRRPTTGQNR